MEAVRKQRRRPVSMFKFAPRSTVAIFALILSPGILGVAFVICFFGAPQSLLAVCDVLLPLTRSVARAVAGPRPFGVHIAEPSLSAIDMVRATLVMLNVVSLVVSVLLTSLTIVRYRTYIPDWIGHQKRQPMNAMIQQTSHGKLIVAGFVIVTVVDVFVTGISPRWWVLRMSGEERFFPGFVAYLSGQFLLMNALASATVQMLLFKFLSSRSNQRLDADSNENQR